MSAAAVSTRLRVAGENPVPSWITRETVAVDTPQRFATW
jgi:hypothetical protein